MLSRVARCAGVLVFLSGAAAADDRPALKIGMLTIHTGAAAAIGDQTENGFRFYLEEHGNKLGGHDVSLKVSDTTGTPAIAKAKAQELVQRERVDMVVGPIGSAEALAIHDFMREAEVPLISSSALAEDLTQRKPSKWFVRATSATGQMSHALGDYAANTLKVRKVVTIATDFAYGHEIVGGFQRVFEDDGGLIVKKIWVPLNATDFSSYLSQIGDVDAVYASFSGAAAQNFIRQYAEFGLKGRLPLLSTHSLVDESLLPEMGDDALGIISSGHYSAAIQNPENQKFVQGFRAAYKVDPGFYAAGGYMAAMFIDEAIKTMKGPATDKRQLMDALRAVRITGSPRGDISLDEFGNPVCDVEIRKVERKDGRLQNVVIKTYPHVSQFWTYEPAKVLAGPVYSRDFPPLRATR